MAFNNGEAIESIITAIFVRKTETRKRERENDTHMHMYVLSQVRSSADCTKIRFHLDICMYIC